MGIQSYEKTVEIERAEGFDRAAAETAISLAFERQGIDGSLDFFPSRNPGVLAFEQLDSFDVDDAAMGRRSSGSPCTTLGSASSPAPSASSFVRLPRPTARRLAALGGLASG